MLEKMKNRVKNEKGFTLVELLAVIVILGIILAIAVPAIGNIVSTSKDNAEDANKALIENAARLADVSGDFDGDTMTLTNLYKAGYLAEIPKVPGTETDYTGTITKSKPTDGTGTEKSVFTFDKTDTEG